MIDRANVENLQMILLYTALLALVTWGGGHTVSYVQDFAFYNTFLTDWRLSIRDYTQRGGKSWPGYAPENLLGYMERVSRVLEQHDGVHPPKGEPGRPFIYRFEKPGQPMQEIFLVAYPGWIRLYGLQPETAQRVDARIDGETDLTAGTFRAEPSGKNDGLLVGNWRL